MNLRRTASQGTVAMNAYQNLLGSVPCPADKRMPATEEVAIGITDNRWLTRTEFEEALTRVDLDSKRRIEAGGPALWSDGSTALVDTGEYHTLIVGSTGSGKSRSLMAPTIDVIEFIRF